jgi:hypothetical protein
VTDIAHQWGSDLMVGPTGDVAVAGPAAVGRQRLLRRLLTNPGEYIWQPDYGAGLSRFIGQPANALQIRAVIRSQIFKGREEPRTGDRCSGITGWSFWHRLRARAVCRRAF